MKVGFVGCGNMGEAMLAGAIAGGAVKAADVAVHVRTASRLDELSAKYRVHPAASNAEVAGVSDVILLAVKPVAYPDVIAQIASAMMPDSVVVGLAPSWSLAQLRTEFAKHGASVSVARAMPNTPANVGKAVSALCFDDSTDDAQRQLVQQFFGSFGLATVVREDLMPAVIAVSGSAPAFVYCVIEALAQGAIALGLPASQAYEMATATVEGSARMVAATGKHPAQLRDEVCSAGGTTIAGVVELERTGMAASIIAAQKAAAQRSIDMV